MTWHFWQHSIAEILSPASIYNKLEEKSVGTCSNDSNYDDKEVIAKKILDTFTTKKHLILFYVPHLSIISKKYQKPIKYTKYVYIYYQNVQLFV